MVDEKIFHYSAPNQDHRDKFEELTALWITVSEVIDKLCPESREKSLAITKLDECRFFANAAIVRRSIPLVTEEVNPGYTEYVAIHTQEDDGN